jgi:hypothetical protein
MISAFSDISVFLLSLNMVQLARIGYTVTEISNFGFLSCKNLKKWNAKILLKIALQNIFFVTHAVLT